MTLYHEQEGDEWRCWNGHVEYVDALSAADIIAEVLAERDDPHRRHRGPRRMGVAL